MTTATIINNRTQAENYVIEMDMVEAELQQATTYELFESCKKSLEMLKSEIVALGYEVKRVPTGWMLVEPVEENAHMNAHEIITRHAEQFDGSAEQEKETALALIKEGSVGTFYQPYVYRCLICGCDTHHVMKVEGWDFPVCQASYEREAACATSTPTVELHEDKQGLYAEVLASTGKGAYTVRVCARWPYTVHAIALLGVIADIGW